MYSRSSHTFSLKL